MRIIFRRIQRKKFKLLASDLMRYGAIARDYLQARIEQHFTSLSYQMNTLKWPKLKSKREWKRIETGKRKAMLRDTGTLAKSARTRWFTYSDKVILQVEDLAGYGKYHAEGTRRLPKRDPYSLIDDEQKELLVKLSKIRLLGT